MDASWQETAHHSPAPSWHLRLSSIRLKDCRELRIANVTSLLGLEIFCDGRLNDHSPDVPAATRFHPDGTVAHMEFHNHGIKRDPAPSHPAEVSFYTTGSPSCVRYFKDGRLHNPSPSAPAMTCFYYDGCVSKTDHYNRGERCNAGDGTPHQVTYGTGGIAQSGIRIDGGYLKVLDALDVRRQIAAARYRKIETLISNAKDVVLIGKNRGGVTPNKSPELSR